MLKGENMKEKKIKEEPIETDEKKMEDAVEALKAQVQHHNTMLIKAQGALEVLTQLLKG
jgi:hypothetical protein